MKNFGFICLRAKSQLSKDLKISNSPLLSPYHSNQLFIPPYTQNKPKENSKVTTSGEKKNFFLLPPLQVNNRNAIYESTKQPKDGKGKI